MKQIFHPFITLDITVILVYGNCYSHNILTKKLQKQKLLIWDLNSYMANGAPDCCQTFSFF